MLFFMLSSQPLILRALPSEHSSRIERESMRKTSRNSEISSGRYNRWQLTKISVLVWKLPDKKSLIKDLWLPLKLCLAAIRWKKAWTPSSSMQQLPNEKRSVGMEKMSVNNLWNLPQSFCFSDRQVHPYRLNGKPAPTKISRKWLAGKEKRPESLIPCDSKPRNRDHIIKKKILHYQRFNLQRLMQQ